MIQSLLLEESKLKDSIERAKQNPNKKPGDIVCLENKLSGVKNAIIKYNTLVSTIIN